MALLLPLAPCPVRITLVLLRAAAPPLSAAGARGPLSLDTSHWIPLTVGLLLPASSHSLLLTTPLTASRFPLTPQVPEDPSDAATAAAVAFRKRTRTDAGAQRASVRASSIFDERRASAKEVQRLQMLQMRRSRGMQLAPTAVCLPPPRHAAARARVTSGGAGAGAGAGAGGGGGGGALRAKGGGEVGSRREGELATSSSSASSSAAAVLPPPMHPAAAQEAARGSGSGRGAVPQGKAVLQGLVGYSDSDSEGDLTQIDV
jgi:hypothetical protein